MLKKTIWALSSGILAGGVSYAYGETIEKQLMEDYSNVVPTTAIFIACLVGTIMATIGHWLLTKLVPMFGEFIFALLFAALSTASLIGVLGSRLLMDLMNYINSFFMATQCRCTFSHF